MPFTISHAAAVLPFARPLARWRLLSATVIGSMVPDFGLLLPWRPSRVETHSAIGLLTFCLPVALATFWIFQQLMKQPIVAVLPDAAYARWRGVAAPADIRSLHQWVLAAFGVLAGAVTHLVWDGFTHEGARGVRMFPALDDPFLDIAGHRLIGSRALQDASSLIGLMVVLAIAAYALRPGPSAAMPLRPPRPLRAGERHVWTLTYLAMTLLLTKMFLGSTDAPVHSLGFIVSNYAIASLRGSAAALVVVSLGLWVRLRATSESARAANP
jgi:hypothetical protein